MDIDAFYQFVFLIITILFSAFFSGSEVSLFSLDKKKIFELKDGNTLVNYIYQLIDAPRRLLVTILLGNTLFNVAASILSVSLALKFAELYHISVDVILIVQIVVLTIIILLIGEVTPKIIAAKNPLLFAKIVSIPLYWISVILFPISKILTDIIKVSTSKIRFDKSSTVILSSEISDLADLGMEKGTLEDGEHEIIHGLVTFKTILAREIMTPRVDIVAIPVTATYEEVIDIIINSGHSRLPLYQDSLDDIIGVIYAKDLLPYIGNEQLKKNLFLRKIARKSVFIPETKHINELLQEFRESNTHMGIVVDEYGGTSGLISLEDILEEIVGEIRDEYDVEENEITRVNDSTYLLLGKVPIDEMNELFEQDFGSENDDYDTVGGFIFNHAGSIPQKGYSFEFHKYKFTVEEVENNRINIVRVEKIN
ncbi:MAG: HlyC/CorC family transporter [Melioribacteraceae bacterium]|nr:HlyC/CorC family transporter [Melioribacteraceae bacterium]